jgi:hypothetical protein
MKGNLEKYISMFILVTTSFFGIIMGLAFFGIGLLQSRFNFILLGLLASFAGIFAVILLFTKILVK